jgi:alkanesulfonate monooxygenase SsuD/methylene tetrahydromethanopterin reductase-like flavin-dependent oxidoreductase (luciferase family)
LRRTVDQGVLAEEVGLDFFSVGEHYRSDMLDSAPPVILAAIAGRTTRIILGTSVTVLSTQDPVRVFHQYSTLNAVSGGRAELVVGRASTIDSFPLFGFQLMDYDDLFEQNLELWGKLMREQPVTWSGSTRATLEAQTLYPRVEGGFLPTWVGVGGSPDSVIRAAYLHEVREGALMIGSPETVATKIATCVRTLDLSRFDFKYALAPLPWEHGNRSVELYGREVVPRIRELLADYAPIDRVSTYASA